MRSLPSLVLLAACAAAPAQFPPGLVLPPRAANARTGSELRPLLQGLPLAARETLLWHEFTAGNVPTLLRTLVPVTVQATVAGQLRTARFFCTRDYLGVGADADWFRMPMTPTLAQQLADRLDCVLPTARMVDRIWSSAALQLAPFPYSPATYDILSLDLFHQHHLQIETQRGTAPQTALVAGIKKDVVASALIASWPGRVCIYGWHQQSGAPIQPLSKVHTFGHVDYSHGIRLVARTMELDGALTTVDAVLADPQLHVLLSGEGTFTSWRYPVGGDEAFPVLDRFPQGPERAAWRTKFTPPVAVPAPAPPPSGDATVVRVMDPAGGTESLRWSPGFVRDVGVECVLYCDHRPQLASDGFERIGVFVRDQAAGAFDGTLSQAGACYALVWDGHDGRLRCLRVQQGMLVDLMPPRLSPGSGWRRFRIDAVGDRLTFWLDGERLLQVVDGTFPSGEFGIGYHEYFATNTHQRGARVDGCHADVPGAFSLGLVPGPASGTLRLQRRRGVPGDLAFTALTLVPGAYPNGWWFGLDPALPDLLGQWTAGSPLFTSWLDATGEHTLVVPGLPLGLPVQGVAIDLDPSLRRWLVGAPVAVTIR
jgi:hypothetical protein